MIPIVVFGGTGFIGSHLVDRLVELGRDVVVICRHLPPVVLTGSSVEYACIPDEAMSANSFAGAIGKAELIFNLAGTSDPASSNFNRVLNLDGNCRLQCQFLQGCSMTNTCPRVIYTSTRLVYGAVKDLPVTENTQVKPNSYYAAHKLCVEHYHQIAAVRGEIDYAICRLSNPYGFCSPSGREWSCFINAMVLRACRSKVIEVFGDGQQLRDYVHISDVVDALVLSATCSLAKNQTINIGSGQSIAIGSACAIVAESTGALVTYRAWPREHQLIETGDYVADLSKAEHDLGFSPKIGFREGVNEVIAKAWQSVREDVLLQPQIA